MKEKKILVITKNIPFPPHTGGDSRIYNLIKRISKEFKVFLICMSDEKLVKNAEDLKAYCEKIYIVPIVTGRSPIQKMLLLAKPREWSRLAIRLSLLLKGYPLGNLAFYHPVFRDKLREILKSHRFAILQFEFIVTGQYLHDIRDLTRSTKTILVQHGMIADELRRMATHSRLPKRIFYDAEALISTKYEKKTIPQFDQVIAMSELDRGNLIAYGIPGHKIAVIRSGVDTEEFRDFGEKGDDKQIVFLGTMKYLPNREGLIWFIEGVFPLIHKEVRDATLTVIGEEDPKISLKYSGDYVVFRGVVERLESEMGKGKIFVAPIRIGTGTRLKIVTAMAFGMPVVSTSVGIEGIKNGEEWGSIIANSEKDFANSVITLLKDQGKRLRIGENARIFVEKDYSWNSIAQNLNALYHNLLSGKQGRVRRTL